jgi:hypothetical protein
MQSRRSAFYAFDNAFMPFAEAFSSNLFYVPRGTFQAAAFCFALFKSNLRRQLPYSTPVFFLH